MIVRVTGRITGARAEVARGRERGVEKENSERTKRMEERRGGRGG